MNEVLAEYLTALLEKALYELKDKKSKFVIINSSDRKESIKIIFNDVEKYYDVFVKSESFKDIFYK